MDNTQKFMGKAEVYAKARPGYAPAFFDYLYSEGGFTSASVIADIGSGTGIFAKALLERGSTVYGVEPNEDMRRSAENSLSGFVNFRPLNGTAENTSLEPCSVDCITAAQAFHWFDAVSFKAECARILKPGGKVVLVWNSRVGSNGVNKENAALFKKYCPDFKGFSGGLEHLDADLKLFFNNGFELKRFANNLQFDKTGFIERCLSASYSLKESDRGYESYINELEALFDKYDVDGVLTLPNETVAYIGI